MNIDRKFISWVFGIICATTVTLVVAEDRWNQQQELAVAKEQIKAAKKAGNGTAYLMYATVVNGLKRDVKRLKLKITKTPEDNLDIEDLEQEIKEIKEHQKGLLE